MISRSQTSALLFILLLFASGCGNETSQTDERNTVRIGAVLNTSGRLSFIGEPTRIALQTYIDVYNKQDSINRNLELVIEDAGSDPSRATDALQRLKLEEPHILVSSTSGTTLALLDQLKNSSKLLIANAGHPNIISELNNSILAFPSPRDEGEEIEALASEGTCFLVRAGDVYHDQFASELRSRLGDRLVGEERYEPGARDFTSIVRRIQSSEPDHIILGGFGVSYGTFIDDLLQRGAARSLIVDTDYLSNRLETYNANIYPYIKFVGTEVANLVGENTPEPKGGPKGHFVRTVIDRFRSRYGRPPKYYAVILLDAVDAALSEMSDRSEDAKSIVKKLHDRPEMSMGSGEVRFKNQRVRIDLSSYTVDRDTTVIKVGFK